MKNLKVLMLNGSPHANGNTAVALREMEEIFKASGVEVETVLIGNQAVRGCTIEHLTLNQGVRGSNP